MSLTTVELVVVKDSKSLGFTWPVAKRAMHYTQGAFSVKRFSHGQIFACQPDTHTRFLWVRRDLYLVSFRHLI